MLRFVFFVCALAAVTSSLAELLGVPEFDSTQQQQQEHFTLDDHQTLNPTLDANVLLGQQLGIVIERLNILEEKNQELSAQLTKESQAIRDHVSKYINKVVVKQPQFSTSCASEETVQEILTSVTSTESKADSLVSSLTSTLTPLIDTCVRKDDHDVAAKEIGDQLQYLLTQGNTSSQAAEWISTRIEELVENLERLEGTVEQVKANTLTTTTTEPPTTTTTTTTTTTAALPPKVMTPCEDSVFQGAHESLNVCEASVRFRKCHLQFIAYHCCSSCTQAGLVSPIGPHRYLSYNRQINVLNALRHLLPAVYVGNN